jgi:hypothetical protein
MSLLTGLLVVLAGTALWLWRANHRLRGTLISHAQAIARYEERERRLRVAVVTAAQPELGASAEFWQRLQHEPTADLVVKSIDDLTFRSAEYRKLWIRAEEHCRCGWGDEVSESDFSEHSVDREKQDANSEALSQRQSTPLLATQVQAPSHALTAQCGGSATEATDSGSALRSAAESVEDAIKAIASEWDDAVCHRLPLEANCLTFDLRRSKDGSVEWYIGVDGCYINGRELPPMWCSLYVENPSAWDTDLGRAAIRARMEELGAWFTRFYPSLSNTPRVPAASCGPVPEPSVSVAT